MAGTREALPITIRGVTKTFGKVTALDDVDLDIRSGEFLTLLGPSGSGKTTLLTLIGALRSAQEGSLVVLGNELRGADEPSLDYLVSRLQRCDIVLIEGFKNGDFPKLEVWRAAVGKPPLGPEWPGIVAVASDTPQAVPTPLPVFALDQPSAIADFVLAQGRPLDARER